MEITVKLDITDKADAALRSVSSDMVKAATILVAGVKIATEKSSQTDAAAGPDSPPASPRRSEPENEQDAAFSVEKREKAKCVGAAPVRSEPAPVEVTDPASAEAPEPTTSEPTAEPDAAKESREVEKPTEALEKEEMRLSLRQAATALQTLVTEHPRDDAAQIAVAVLTERYGTPKLTAIGAEHYAEAIEVVRAALKKA